MIAQNKSYLSVQVTWRLTDHGVFTFAIVSLSLRLLDSSNWSHVVNNISQYHVFYKFEHLQPCSQYLLNVTLHNNYKQTESRALVFWSAATNSSGRRDLMLGNLNTVVREPRTATRSRMFPFLAWFCSLPRTGKALVDDCGLCHKRDGVKTPQKGKHSTSGCRPWLKNVCA